MAENPLETIARLDPGMMEKLKTVDQFVFGDGALPRKIKLLMALAFDAAHGAADGVAALARQAVAAGAGTAEIAEAVRVAWHLAGIGSVYAASRGLKDIAG